jgi:hypothetical protein
MEMRSERPGGGACPNKREIEGSTDQDMEFDGGTPEKRGGERRGRIDR